MVIVIDKLLYFTFLSQFFLNIHPDEILFCF